MLKHQQGFFPNVSRCFMMWYISWNGGFVHIRSYFFMMWSFNLVTDIAEVTGTWPWIQSRCQRKCEGLQWFTRSFSLDSVGYAFWCVSDDKKMSAGSTHQSSPAQPEGLEGSRGINWNWECRFVKRLAVRIWTENFRIALTNSNLLDGRTPCH